MSDVDPDPAEARWHAVLDDLEAAVTRQRAALAAGDHADPTVFARLAFVPPPDLPPIPDTLAERALGLQRETDELIEHTRSLVERVAPTGPHGTQPSGHHAGLIGARRSAPRFDRRM